MLDGEDITELSITERAKKGISFAFQQPVRFKGITVHDLISLASGRDVSIAEACDYLSQVGLVDAFDELVSGHMVEHGKPAPDIYLYAASKLGLKPEECLVLEDSPTGLLAAFRAGCIPVMVPDQDQPDDEVKSRVYAVVQNLVAVQSLFSTSPLQCE